jgi:hypothetical protein
MVRVIGEALHHEANFAGGVGTATRIKQIKERTDTCLLSVDSYGCIGDVIRFDSLAFPGTASPAICAPSFE